MAEKEFKLGNLEEQYDEVLLEYLDEIGEPLKDVVDRVLDKAQTDKIAKLFRTIANHYDKIDTALNNYTSIVAGIDKEKDLDELELRRADVEEMLEGVRFEVEKLVDYLKKEV